MREQPNDTTPARELAEGGALVVARGRVQSPIADDAPRHQPSLRSLTSFCRESPNSTVESRFSAFFAARFACSLMCGVTHISDDSRKD